MNKKEMAKVLRKKISEALRKLPDVEYRRVSIFHDFTSPEEFRRESHTQLGAVHSIEIGIEEVCDAD